MIDCGTYRFDLCDRCGAKAVQRAFWRDGLDLMLCQHHFNQYETALQERLWMHEALT